MGQGLFRKYVVLRADTAENVSDATLTFTLVPERDEHARVALRAYADSVARSSDDGENLADEIYDRLDREDYSPAPREAA
jgi:hypothetical protein